MDDNGESYNISELFLQQSVTTSNTPIRSSRARRAEASNTPSLLDLPTEIRLQIYDALLLVTRKHPSQTRLRAAHEESRRIREVRHDSTQAYYVYKGLKKCKSPFPSAVRPPALSLFLTCRQVYREFAPIFFAHSSIIISDDIVLAPEVLETVIPSSPITAVARNGLDDEAGGGQKLESLLATPPPLLLVRELYIYVSTPAPQRIASLWIKAIRRIAKATQHGKLRMLTFVLDHRKGLYGGPRIGLCPYFKDDDDWDGSIVDDPPRDLVELARNKAIARALTQISGLERLVARGFCPGGFPAQFDEHLHPEMQIYTAGRHRYPKQVTPGWRRSVTMRVMYIRGAACSDNAVLPSEHIDNGVLSTKRSQRSNNSLSARVNGYLKVGSNW